MGFFQNVFSLPLLALAAPWFGVLPGVESVPSIVAVAGLSLFSVVLLSWAYARAEAQVLLPVEYTAFVWAAIIGWIFFSEPLTLDTLIGTGMIVAGCLISARQQPVHIETTTA